MSNTVRLGFLMKILDRKDAINHHKDAINRRQDERLIIVETAIHRVSCLNRTVLGDEGEFCICASGLLNGFGENI